MDNFRVIYKILKYLEAALDCDNPDFGAISAENLGVTKIRRDRLLIMLQDVGYISGLMTIVALDEPGERIYEPIHPNITVRGLEYLNENNIMQRIACK